MTVLRTGTRHRRSHLPLLEGRSYENLIDFDNHLDDLRNDWTNPVINKSVLDLCEESQSREPWTRRQILLPFQHAWCYLSCSTGVQKCWTHGLCSIKRPSYWGELAEHWLGYPKSLKGKRHLCTVGMCPPLQGDTEVMKAIMFLTASVMFFFLQWFVFIHSCVHKVKF